MAVDVTLVLFKPRWEQVEQTLEALSLCQDEFLTLRILLSGTESDLQIVDSLLEQLNLVDVSCVLHRWDNVGFAAGHNHLLAAAFESYSDFCLVLNPDVVLAHDAISKLVRTAYAYPGELLGPSLASLERDGAKVVDSFGISWDAFGRHYDLDQDGVWTIPEGRSRVVEGLTGACLLVSRSVYRSICSGSGEFFREIFLAYREDAELGVRARKLGISSRLIFLDGFEHSRYVRGHDRRHSLANLLGVRNRFLLRWCLGTWRPGRWGLATVRDLLVAGGALGMERGSLPGLTEAWRVRRTCKFQRRRVDEAMAESPVT